MARFTKSSKHSDLHIKFSMLDGKKKEKKSQSKSKKKRTRKESVSKPKKQSSSLSKSPYSKSPRPKESILVKSPRSPKTKETISYKSPTNSLKHISNPIRMQLQKHIQERQKTLSKSKKKSKIGNNEYFLERHNKTHKKTSVSSKKSSLNTKSTIKLPLHSTLEAKDMPQPKLSKEKKKNPKKSLLQHYL
jgi:hypothetical protein